MGQSLAQTCGQIICRGIGKRCYQHIAPRLGLCVGIYQVQRAQIVDQRAMRCRGHTAQLHITPR